MAGSPFDAESPSHDGPVARPFLKSKYRGGNMNTIVNGFNMAYSASGKGQPLVLVHGYPLNREIWQPQVEGLAGIARVLAPAPHELSPEV